jgi:hypothetical protein
MRRIGWSTVWIAAIAAGCNGFPDAIPISDAERAPEKYPTYAAAPPTTLIQVGTQRYMVLPGAVVHVPASALRSVAGGLSAGLWDSEPFDWLYQRSADGKVRFAGEIR